MGQSVTNKSGGVNVIDVSGDWPPAKEYPNIVLLALWTNSETNLEIAFKHLTAALFVHVTSTNYQNLD